MNRILLADDCAVTRQLLTMQLSDWGYAVVAASDGAEAWEQLRSPAAPQLAILDWSMPRLTGIEICHLIRSQKPEPYTYVILLTANSTSDDLAAGFAAGADDYISKPFEIQVLQARLRAGERILRLEQTLGKKIQELEVVLTQVNQLHALLPICMFCKKIRDDNDYWHQIEAYLHQQAGTDFSHGVCLECFSKRHELLTAKSPL